MSVSESRQIYSLCVKTERQFIKELLIFFIISGYLIHINEHSTLSPNHNRLLASCLKEQSRNFEDCNWNGILTNLLCEILTLKNINKFIYFQLSYVKCRTFKKLYSMCWWLFSIRLFCSMMCSSALCWKLRWSFYYLI